MSALKMICEWLFNTPKDNMRTFNEKQASNEAITRVFYAINEIQLSIYRFLLNIKKISNLPFPVELYLYQFWH